MYGNVLDYLYCTYIVYKYENMCLCRNISRYRQVPATVK